MFLGIVFSCPYTLAQIEAAHMHVYVQSPLLCNLEHLLFPQEVDDTIVFNYLTF